MSGFNCGFLKGPDCSDVFDLLVMFFGVKTLRARVCVCFCFFLILILTFSCAGMRFRIAPA